MKDLRGQAREAAEGDRVRFVFENHVSHCSGEEDGSGGQEAGRQETQGGGPAAKGQATDAEVSPKKVPEASENKRDGAQLQGPGLGPLDLLP